MTSVNETKMNFNKPVKGNFLEEQVHYPVFSTAAETELAYVETNNKGRPNRTAIFLILFLISVHPLPIKG
ncbi:hypothetical protein M4A92_16890 [Caldibacillus thermoamylovorans]|uniref:hypothetical protein n=1 Tax=Caldibacillus thermoamylovorans TaxID=35841 RepID=UPI002040141E|nr:hypothetical protein [Caldibacillus thermoamylovorans]MCM3800249.1 hypothetical protein [Caldibacillus thermoamylovorans]